MFPLASMSRVCYLGAPWLDLFSSLIQTNFGSKKKTKTFRKYGSKIKNGYLGSWLRTQISVTGTRCLKKKQNCKINVIFSNANLPQFLLQNVNDLPPYFLIIFLVIKFGFGRGCLAVDYTSATYERTAKHISLSSFTAFNAGTCHVVSRIDTRWHGWCTFQCQAIYRLFMVAAKTTYRYLQQHITYVRIYEKNEPLSGCRCWSIFALGVPHCGIVVTFAAESWHTQLFVEKSLFFVVAKFAFWNLHGLWCHLFAK